MDIKKIRAYADLIVRTGINVKKGQEVVINAELDCPEFVEMLMESVYECGASKVEVKWTHQPLTLLKVKYESPETLGRVEKWEEEKLKRMTDTLPCMIYILSEDPNGLNGIDREKYAKSRSARYGIIKPYNDEMENKYQWCIAAVPGVKWAKTIYKDLSAEEAVERLWEDILYTSRALNDDPIKAWDEHNEDLKNRYTYLNDLHIKSLHYTASNGTDLTVGLIDNSVWMGGGEYTINGNFFNANIPSEEIFISPHREKCDGIVYASKPLSYRGELIKDFYIKFEGGKVVEAKAKENDELLQLLISTDEGAGHLGECALVPFDSPIQNRGVLFYNTLFDENASCHLALGMGFSNTIKDFVKYTLEECREMGINDSQVHEDFMIGTADLTITATTFDGREVPIFTEGNWAF